MNLLSGATKHCNSNQTNVRLNIAPYRKDEVTTLVKTCADRHTDPYTYCDQLSLQHSQIGICELINNIFKLIH